MNYIESSHVIECHKIAHDQCHPGAIQKSEIKIGKLTDIAIKNAQAGERDLQLSDGDGLVLRLGRNSGDKSFWYRYKRGNSSKWVRIGNYPTISLKKARGHAQLIDHKRKQGIDPIEEREQLATSQKAEQAATDQAFAAQQARMTVKLLFERWESLELKGRKDKGVEVRRTFVKDIFPTIGEVAAEEVKRSMIAACLDKVVERGSPIIARNLLGDLRQMFGFAIKHEYVENDPTSHLKRDDFGKKIERDRVLDDAEIKLLDKLFPDAQLHETTIAACWIMLATCCRVGEVIQARWEHIDLQAGTWRIPPDNAKNGKEHTVYLSSFAKDHFKTLKRLVEESAKDKNGKQIAEVSPWVLHASHKPGHFCLKSISKQIGDRQRGDKQPMKNWSKATKSLELPRGKWTPHDLRRTGATLMGSLGVRPDIIEKCLNHVEQNRLVRIYQRQTIVAEQAEAWRLLGERLELLTSENPNVIELHPVAA